MESSADHPEDLHQRLKLESALEGGAVPTDREAWLRQWRTLSADISAATTGDASLVDQLSRDRR